MIELKLPQDVEGIIDRLEKNLDERIKVKKFWNNVALGNHRTGTELELDINNTGCYFAIINMLARQIRLRVETLDRIYDALPSLFTNERSEKFNRYFVYLPEDDYRQDL